MALKSFKMRYYYIYQEKILLEFYLKQIFSLLLKRGNKKWD